MKGKFSHIINNEYHKWDRDTINCILEIFEHKRYNKLYNINLNILNNYIEWYKKNYLDNMYKLENLMQIYCYINEDIYFNRNYNYIKILNDMEIKDNDVEIFNLCDSFDIFNIMVALILVIIYIIFRFGSLGGCFEVGRFGQRLVPRMNPQINIYTISAV